LDSTSDKSVNDLKAVGNFLTLTGRLGKENNGILILREFNNSVGSIEMGVNPDYLPGYVRSSDVNEINRISKLWNVDLNGSFKQVDLSKKLRKGEIKGAIIFGEDPLSIKNNRKYFGGIEFLVVCDAFHTETTSEADVVLPAATYLEQSGSYTRCDNKIQFAPKVINGFHNFENWEIISKLGAHFNKGIMFKSFEEITKEIKKINRFAEYSVKEYTWHTGFINNGFTNKEIKLADSKVDLSTFDPIKPIIHYQENYYFSNIKMKLM
jgi:predicted molibdopterin-dependent oxidoreductase YjgC